MKIALFMTYGGSLEGWDQAGILERELALYREHADAGWGIHLISYGDSAAEPELAAGYPYVSVHWNRLALHPRIYAGALPCLHARPLREASIYKTNQLYGSHIAHRCAAIWRKPIAVRQGYGYYEHRAEEHGKGSKSANQALRYERDSLRRADVSIFTTDALASRAIERHRLSDDSVVVVANYLVPEVWTPPYRPTERARPFRFVFYGRYTEQKNLVAFIEAIAGLPVEVHMIGEGPLLDTYKEAAAATGASCLFSPRMAQAELRDALADADAFVLPSHYEGHPKALIEAMAFGLPVLAADSRGISELVGDLDFVVMAPASCEGLRRGVEELRSTSHERRAEMGQKGRQWALERFSVSAIAAKEREILQHTAERG